MSEKYSLHLEGLTLEALAKVVLALKGTTAVVAGSGAAVPQAAASAPTVAATASVVASAPAPAPLAQAPAPAAPNPVPGALTHEDVMQAFKANLARIKAPGVQAVNAQFGIASPLALKERPQDWAGYIAALNASPSA